MAMTAEERLAEQLDAKDEEIAALDRKIDDLETQLRCCATAWSMPEKIDDDASLPLPRLEMVWTQRDEWETVVKYRLVRKHLLGHVETCPLGMTTISGGNGIHRDDAGAPSLPYRDGSHATHDSAHLGLPLYLIVGNEPAIPFCDWEDYKHQIAKGRSHRRPAGVTTKATDEAAGGR